MDNVRLNHSLYDANSPLLCSTLSLDDKVTKHVVKSFVDDQIGRCEFWLFFEKNL